MDKKTLTATAKDIFGRYSKRDSLHFTSDGSPFFEKHDALTHARSLKDQEITTIERSEIKGNTKVVIDLKPKTREQLVIEYKQTFGVDPADTADENALAFAISTGEAIAPVSTDTLNVDDKDAKGKTQTGNSDVANAATVTGSGSQEDHDEADKVTLTRKEKLTLYAELYGKNASAAIKNDALDAAIAAKQADKA